MARLITGSKKVAILTKQLNYPGQPVWGDPILGGALASAINKIGGYKATVCDPKTFEDNYDYTICMYAPSEVPIPKKFLWEKGMTNDSARNGTARPSYYTTNDCTAEIFFEIIHNLILKWEKV